MKPTYLTPQALDQFIQSALVEDIGPGDYSSLSSIPPGKTGQAKLILKEEGILAGMELAGLIFQKVDPHYLRLCFSKMTVIPSALVRLAYLSQGPLLRFCLQKDWC
jgi:hypothetical protein